MKLPRARFAEQVAQILGSVRLPVNTLNTKWGVYPNCVTIILYNASLFPINTVAVAAVVGHREVLHAQVHVENEFA